MKKAIRDMLKKIPIVKRSLETFRSIANLNQRLTYLEKRVHNYRWEAAEIAADYLVGAQIDGDYCEFGVYKGDTFAHFMRYHSVFPNMRYFALDSFQGLPAPTGIDTENGYTSNFREGEFAVSEEDFLANVRSKGLPMDKVVTVKGWYDITLNDVTAQKYNLNKVAFAWVDCDFYESTVPVLDFLTSRLSVGSLIAFDDWKVYRNLADKGQQKACREWLEKNPSLQLNQIFDFSHYGRAFTVASVPS